MRKLVVTMYITLDGVMEAPENWSGQFWNDEAIKFKYDELFASGAILLGRVTYQDLAGYWPTATAEGDFVTRINSLPKYVVSSTLEELEWSNSRLIKGDIAAEVSRLKQQRGQDILIYGSADLVNLLMKHNLIDEYRLMVHPIVFGSGKRLFKDNNVPRPLKLVASKPLSTGIVILTYQPGQDK
jgi:dihydrofolate reductase